MKGENDWKKGNRTNSLRNPTKIKAMHAQYCQEIQGYKEYAAARRATRVWTQERVGELYYKLVEYAEECERKKEPLTVAGTILATGMSRSAWDKAGAEEFDFLLEEYIDLHEIGPGDIEMRDDLPWYTDENGEEVLLITYGALKEKADLMIQRQLERNCYTNRGNPAGSIFSLKAKFDWREEASPSQLVQQLVVADVEQAKKALNMLK